MTFEKRILRPRQEFKPVVVDKDGFINKFNQTIDNINSVSDEIINNRLLFACEFLISVLITEKYRTCMSFELASTLILSMKGAKRSIIIIRLLLSRNFVEATTITQQNINNLLLSLNLKDNKLNEEINELFVNYKRVKTYKDLKPADIYPIHPDDKWPTFTTQLSLNTPKDNNYIYNPKSITKPRHFTPERNTERSKYALTSYIDKIPIDELRLKIRNKDIDNLCIGNYETHLSDDDFILTFGITKDEFYELPKWKQTNIKSIAKLF